MTLVELRNTHAESPIPVLPLKYEATVVQESRGVCFEDVDCGCQRYCCGQEEEKMAVVRHSSCSEKRDFMPACDRCNKRIESFLEFHWDQIFSVLGAVDRVDIIVGIGMAHVRGKVSRRITRMVPRLRRSGSSSGFIPQPCRAGLTFSGRPSGPFDQLIGRTFNHFAGRR